MREELDAWSRGVEMRKVRASGRSVDRSIGRVALKQPATAATRDHASTRCGASGRSIGRVARTTCVSRPIGRRGAREQTIVFDRSAAQRIVIAKDSVIVLNISFPSANLIPERRERKLPVEGRWRTLPPWR